MHDFKEYERQAEPAQKEKALIWQTAIGLQEVDGLKPSSYLIKNAKEHIDGVITIDEVKMRLESYYEQMPIKDAQRTEEADKVSARITEILSEKTFYFSPLQLENIHGRLFYDMLFDKKGQSLAGVIRPYNISKKEWVLMEDTVSYVEFNMIKKALEYDFNTEKIYNYKNLSLQDKVKHLAKFIAGIWQIHPFCEGNTRTIAVFTIKYLRTFGFEVNNDLFATESWYFRNALVRANYSNFVKGVYATQKYLDMFFDNLLFGAGHPLHNKELQVGTDSGTVNGTVSLTTAEKIKSVIRGNANVTTMQIATTLSIGLRTVKRYIKELKDAGQVERVGGDKFGYWKVVK